MYNFKNWDNFHKSLHILNMKKSQRKRYHRVFAALLFYTCALFRFIDAQSLNLAKKIKVIVVAESKMSQASKFLVELLNESGKSEAAIESEWLTPWQFGAVAQKVRNSNQLVIFFGDFRASVALSKSIRTWEFTKFDLRFGWLDRFAFVSFSGVPSSAMLLRMVDFAQHEVTSEIDLSEALETDFWGERSILQKVLIVSAGVVLVSAIGAGVAAIIGSAKDKKSLKKCVSGEDEVIIDDTQGGKADSDSTGDEFYEEVSREFWQRNQEIFDSMADDGSEGDDDEAFRRAKEEILESYPELDELTFDMAISIDVEDDFSDDFEMNDDVDADDDAVFLWIDDADELFDNYDYVCDDVWWRE